jgi:hypothetical protein
MHRPTAGLELAAILLQLLRAGNLLPQHRALMRAPFFLISRLVMARLSEAAGV